MRISCADTSRARNNLESAATLGKQPAGLLGYIQTFNDNGVLYVHYWWGRRFHAISDRRKIIFGENYIDLKYDRSTAYFLSECFILFVPIAGLLYVIGEFVFSLLFLNRINFDVMMLLLCLWIIWALKFGPMLHVKNYVKDKIK